MDADLFDRLARAVHHRDTRRGVLQVLAGGSLAVVGALVAGNEAAARCRPRSRRCGPGRCCDKGEVCGDKEGQICVTGIGTCERDSNICRNQGTVNCASTVGGTESCICVESVSGQTRCAVQGFLGVGCNDPCTKDADCQTEFPDTVGAFCVKGAGCCLSGNACAAPCPPDGV